MTLGQVVPKLDALHLMDGIEGLRSLPKHSVDMLLTDPPYGTTRNFWDVPLPLPERWEAVRWAVKPNGTILFFAQCPFDKVLGASNLAMLRYEWVWYKSRATGFLNANRAPLKKSENILVFYQKSPVYHPQFTYGEPYRKTNPRSGCSTNYGKFERTGSESSDGRRYPGNVLFVPTVMGGIHPTQKPVELCEYFIKTYTDEGAVVADICYVTLENFNLSHLPVYIMGEETLSRYALYMATLGNRPDLFPSSPYVGKYTSKPPAHEIPEDYLADETFAAILKEAEKYVGYPYVWGGSSPSTSFDCSGFVSYVYNQCGWDFGRLGAQGLYNISTRTSSPKPGDLVFFTGTYDTPGISHVGIYVGDGWMLHCGDPISYANLNTSYWQSHFYAYGKLF